MFSPCPSGKDPESGSFSPLKGVAHGNHQSKTRQKRTALPRKEAGSLRRRKRSGRLVERIPNGKWNSLREVHHLRSSPLPRPRPRPASPLTRFDGRVRDLVAAAGVGCSGRHVDRLDGDLLDRPSPARRRFRRANRRCKLVTESDGLHFERNGRQRLPRCVSNPS